jgi:UDP-glucose 4-epimerase
VSTPERVFITGGNGFLGASLVRAEVAAGNEVHLLLRPQSCLWRLKGLEGLYLPHRGDLRDAAAVRRAVAACRPEVVYHLAAEGVRPGPTDRATLLATALLGTANLLDALAGHDYRALVQAGSGAEYGPCPQAVPEGAAVRPWTDYAVAKAATSLLCQAEARRGRPVVTVRIFAAYGPWEAPQRLVPYVMDCCTRGQAPRLSAGWQRRDHVFAEDAVALLRAAAHAPQVAGEVLHAGTGQAHSVREVVAAVLALGGCALRPVFGDEPTRAAEPLLYLAAIERTVALTGWRPHFDLTAGLARTWEWFRATRAAAAA